jgi:hypothetical protein
LKRPSLPFGEATIGVGEGGNLPFPTSEYVQRGPEVILPFSSRGGENCPSAYMINNNKK